MTTTNNHHIMVCGKRGVCAAWLGFCRGFSQERDEDPLNWITVITFATTTVVVVIVIVFIGIIVDCVVLRVSACRERFRLS